MPSNLQRGALTGLALLLVATAAADQALRDRIHREYRHQSYMLLESEDGWELYVLGDREPHVMRPRAEPDPAIPAALHKTRSSAARERVRGLLELAGADAPEALDAALQLLNDPSAAVRDEARSLILDHPDGAEIAAALGLSDEDLAEQED
jgi:hypothetical protein